MPETFIFSAQAVPAQKAKGAGGGALNDPEQRLVRKVDQADPDAEQDQEKGLGPGRNMTADLGRGFFGEMRGQEFVKAVFARHGRQFFTHDISPFKRSFSFCLMR